MVTFTRPGHGHLAAEGDPPVGQYQHPAGQHECLVDVMGDEQDRRPVVRPQPQNRPEHGDPGQRVQGAERLVRQERGGRACYSVSSSSAAVPSVPPCSGLVASTMLTANFRWELSRCSAKS